jgi:hypothetical protein
MTRVCPCGESLEGRRHDVRYCSGACRMAAYRVRKSAHGPTGGNTLAEGSVTVSDGFLERSLDFWTGLARIRRRGRELR